MIGLRLTLPRCKLGGMRCLLFLMALTALAWPAGSYFPMSEGWSWTYHWSAKDQEFDYTVEVVKSEPGRSLLRTRMPRVLTQEWYEERQDALVVSGLEDPEGTRVVYTPPRAYLTYPLSAGRKWEWSGTLGESAPIRDRNRVISESSIQVPAGTFTCLVVETITTQGDGSLNQLSYYAPGVGLVKNVSDSAAGRWVSVLKSYRPGKR